MATVIQNRLKKSEDELMEEKMGRVFLRVPNDCLTRPQREHLFGILFRRIQAVSDQADLSPAQWKLVLAVLTKVMKRPTFPEVCLIRLFERFRRASSVNDTAGAGVQGSGDDS